MDNEKWGNGNLKIAVTEPISNSLGNNIKTALIQQQQINGVWPQSNLSCQEGFSEFGLNANNTEEQKEKD